MLGFGRKKKSFKTLFSFEERVAESARIREKHPNRIPVIVEKAEKSNNVPDIENIKHLVPGDDIVGHLVYVIRKKIKLDAAQALFVFVDDVLPVTTASMFSVYEEHKDEDGFLYVTYSGENTFGIC